MRPLSAADLLHVWERGRAEPPVRRALLLLAAAAPDAPAEALARLPVGRRDALLLDLREQTFGPRLDAVVNCPRCGEALDFGFDAADVRAGAGAEPGATFTACAGAWEVEFRPPDSADLLAAAGADAGEMAARLLGRCVLKAACDGTGADAAALPPEVVAAVANGMAEADPPADVRLALTCPACGHAWETPFDVASYFWGEVRAAALRALRDVHELARAYGWREADVLTLSPLRRQAYLELVRG